MRQSPAEVELAPGKARTAVLFRKPSQAQEDAINIGRIAATTAPFIEMKAALSIVLDGAVIGAIGASADTPDNHVQIARVGLATLSRNLPGRLHRLTPVCDAQRAGRRRPGQLGWPKNADAENAE